MKFEMMCRGNRISHKTEIVAQGISGTQLEPRSRGGVRLDVYLGAQFLGFWFSLVLKHLEMTSNFNAWER